MCEDVERQLALLKDPDDELREDAADALWRLGDRRAIPALRDALGDENWRVRAQAAYSLIKLGDVDSVPALMDMLRAGKGPRGVVPALVELGHRVVPLMRKAARDRDPSVSSIAKWVLSDLEQIGDVQNGDDS